MLARIKLNSIESKVSEALINSGISHEDFIIIINEEKNYRQLKINLIEEGKKIGINEVIKRNEVINNNLKYQIQYKMMLSYCLKCKKIVKAQILEFQKQPIVKQ